MSHSAGMPGLRLGLLAVVSDSPHEPAVAAVTDLADTRAAAVEAAD